MTPGASAAKRGFAATGAAPGDGPPIAVEPGREALERVLRSGAFQSSESHSRLLRYLVEQTLSGQGDHLKEYSIGVDALGRGRSFDPKIESVVRVEVSRLRRRLSDYYQSEGREDAIRIEVPRGTYVPRFLTAAALDASPQAGPPDDEEVASTEVRPARWLWWLGVLATLTLVVAVFAWRAASTGSAGPVDSSIAVMPFANLSPEKETEYFSDGVTEEVRSSLARLPGVRVSSRSSTARFKGNATDAREVGKLLGVSSVLEGSVRKADDRLRISVQLVDTRNGYQLWSEVYDRPVRDVLAIQDEIARAIAGTLRVRLPAGEAASAAPRKERNGEAYNLVLKARYLGTAADVADAKVGYFRQALALDPEYAAAHLGLAQTLMQLAATGAAKPSSVMPQAAEAVRAGLKSDPNLADAHRMNAYLQYAWEWDWEGAERAYRRAMELDPASSMARIQYARLLGYLGRKDEALAQLREVQELAPASPGERAVEAEIYYMTGDYARTISHTGALMTGRPSDRLFEYWKGRAHLAKGQIAEAVDALEKWKSKAESERGRGFGMLAVAYARAGRRADAERILDDVMARSRRRYSSALSVSMVHAALGDLGAAMDWIERAVAERDTAIVTLKVEPAYNVLRSQPRFQAVLRRVRLD